MIGRGQVEAQHPEDRPQKALRLTKGQVKDQAERQRGFDGNLGVLQLPSALADAHGLPRGDRFRRQPQGDVASLDQCSVRTPASFRRGISLCTWDALSTSRRDHAPSAVTMARAATNTCFRAPTPRCGEIAFRPTHDVGPHKQCMSGLNHAAYGLPVNASRPGSPQAHASLGSGWRPTLAGWDWFPTGFRTRFQRSHHGILSPLTGLSRHTRWCTNPE